MSRAHTREEMRRMFLEHLVNIGRYWENLPGKTTRERIEGAIFSTLVAIDGGALGLPSHLLIPSPHPEDEAYHRELEDNFYPEGVDIAGELHSEFFQIAKPPAGGEEGR